VESFLRRREIMLKLKNKAQSTAEYAIVIGLVIAAVVAMQIYVRRGIQAKIKDAVDYNDPQATMLSGQPYEPDYTGSNMTSTSDTHETEKVAFGGSVNRVINEDAGGDVSTRTGKQVIYAP